MFEMACGRPPFIAQTIPEAYTKHVMTPAPSPSQFAPGLPPAVEQLILRLLAKDPSERAVSMGQVTRELAELAGEPLSNEPRRPSQPVASQATPLPPNATTLGASAAEIQPATRRSTALIVSIAGLAVAMVVVVIVMVAGKNKDEHHAAAQPAVPAAAPAVAPPPPAPADAAVAVEPPPVPADAAIAAVAAPPEPPAKTVQKPKPKPVAKPKPAAGSAAKPPSGDDDFGGRL
jgi:serine/threonine-protein kinase